MAKKTEFNLTPEQVPQHVAFIMDGNGRWAKKRGLPRKVGHAEGARTLKKILRHAKSRGVKYASFYCFSTENWKRPGEEVKSLMKLFNEYLLDVSEIIKEEARTIVIGDKSGFDEELRNNMIKLEQDTAHFTEFTLIVAMNYGSRQEIAHACREIAKEVKSGALNPDEIDENVVENHLFTAGLPDVDLLIRPSGELRLSNYMLWQCSYAELYFEDIMWPDFSPKDLDNALMEYARRNRRFGGL